MAMTTGFMRLVPSRGACPETAHGAWNFSEKPAHCRAAKDPHFSVFSIKKWALSAIWRLSRRYNSAFTVTECAPRCSQRCGSKANREKLAKGRHPGGWG